MEDCQWCDHDSNRGDNFKTHLEKHLKAESKSPRVKIVQDPVQRAKIQELLAEIGTRPRKGVKAEAKPKAKAVPRSEVKPRIKQDLDLDRLSLCT